MLLIKHVSKRGWGFIASKGAFCRTVCLGLSGTRFLCFSRRKPTRSSQTPCSTRKSLLHHVNLVSTFLCLCISQQILQIGMHLWGWFGQICKWYDYVVHVALSLEIETSNSNLWMNPTHTMMLTIKEQACVAEANHICKHHG